MGKESKENQTTCFITGPIFKVCFVKKCTFWKNFFLQLIQKCQNNFQIGGIQPPPALLDYLSALLSSESTLLLKQRALSHEQFKSVLHFK